jgi:ACT domain-containing protein
MSSFQQNVINKIGLLKLAAELGNVSRVCKVMGFSRDTFYRYQAAVEAGGAEALIDANRRILFLPPFREGRIVNVIQYAKFFYPFIWFAFFFANTKKPPAMIEIQ